MGSVNVQAYINVITVLLIPTSRHHLSHSQLFVLALFLVLFYLLRYFEFALLGSNIAIERKYAAILQCCSADILRKT